MYMHALFCLCVFQNRDNGTTYNVIDVWKRNVTGAGVVVAVVDEGFDPEHPEIKDNYVSHTHCLLLIQGGHNYSFELAGGCIVAVGS